MPAPLHGHQSFKMVRATAPQVRREPPPRWGDLRVGKPRRDLEVGTGQVLGKVQMPGAAK